MRYRNLYKENYGSNKGNRPGLHKRDNKDFFIFDIWFSSNKSSEAAMDLGAEIIGMVKNNYKGSCKDTTDNLTKNCPGGSYLVLR